MMNKSHIFIVLTTFAIMCGCVSQSRAEGDWGSIEDYYVDEYVNLKEIGLWVYRTEDSLLYIRYTTQRIQNQQTEREKWGDVGGSYLHGDANPPIFALSHSFDGITITSDTDFNDVTAGNSLGGKVEFLSGSASPVIAAKNLGSFLYYFHPADKPLEELTKQDLCLLDARMGRFKFLELPEQPVQNLTFTYYEGDTKWTCTFKLDFTQNAIEIPDRYTGGPVIPD